MSNLANKLAVPLASKLAVGITSGINENYAAIINDNGELASYVTFTRSSTATRYNSAGLLETVAANSPRYDYDPTTITRANFMTESGFRNGVTDAPTRSGLITSAAFSSFIESTAIAFGHDGVTSSFAYKAGAVTGLTYCFSAYVRMDDGGAPVFGSVNQSDPANTFAIVIAGDIANPLTYTVQNLGGGLYRVSGSRVAGALTPNSGIVKYNTNNSRTFTVTGYQLETGTVANGYIPTGTFERGPELVANGDFSQGATGWIVDNAALVISGGVVTSNADVSKTVYQTESRIVSGRTYKVTYTASGLTVNGIRINVRTPADNIQTPYNNTNGTVTTIFTASVSGAFGLFCFANGVTIDNISVKEINADYASPRGNATLRGLLIEEQRTNLAQHSAAFDNAAWLVGLFGNHVKPTVAANTSVAPDGTLSGDQLTSTHATASTIGSSISAATPSQAYTVSCWIRAGTATQASLGLAWGLSGAYVSENITTVNLTSQYQRFTFTATCPGTGVDQVQLTLSLGNRVSGGGIGTTLEVWGAQLEAGAFATSYIPTTTASVTRAFDSAIVNTLSSIGFNTAQGSIYSEFDVIAVNTAFRSAVYGTSDSGFNRLALRASDSAINYPIGAIGTGTGVVSLAGSPITANTPVRIAMAYGSNMGYSQNGAAPVTNASASAVGGTAFSIGSVGGVLPLNGHIRRLRYYPRRINDTQLQALTA